MIDGVTRQRSLVLVTLLAGCRDTAATGGASSSSDAVDSSGSTISPTTTTTATSSSSTTNHEDSSSSAVTTEGTTTTGGTDTLPPVPLLITPIADSLDEPLEVSLCWEPVEDPDGEPVRYRVWIDEIELTNGIVDEDWGYEGDCTGPLSFEDDRTYSWYVRAAEADDRDRVSEPSERRSFTVEGDASVHTVFIDRFDDDLGWVVDGDATTGAWVRSDPIGTQDGDVPAQSNRCDRGYSCWFTGQNPQGDVDDADVDGGSTTLLSPPLTLGGAAAATIELRRWFYKSDAGPGPALQIELLVPDDEAPEGFVVHPLELLDGPTASEPENAWRAVEYAVCGVPMVDGSQLRITAIDHGAGILEAAIDTVRVRTHDSAAVCGSGEGGQCDPLLGDAACPDALLCCPQGIVVSGINRCATAVAALDPDAPPATPESPNNGPLGCDAPDLQIDPSWIMPVTTDIMIGENTCELLEGCVGGTGVRTILRFALVAQNIGSKDLVLGVAANNPDVFHYSECHDHHHFDDFATYELLDGANVVARGRKQAFCLLDTYSWAWENAYGKYDCANQGISRGFADIYEDDLPCQWIDVTDVPPGDYTLRAVLNPMQPGSTTPLLVERDWTNNTVEHPVTLE